MAARPIPPLIEDAAAELVQAPQDSLVAAIARRVAADPQREAVSGATTSLTYRELDDASSAPAAVLHARLVAGRAARVAMLLDHDAPAVAAFVAILKCGAAAVALNPLEPEVRLAAIV